MKKLLTVVLASLMALSIMTGCSGKESSNSESNSETKTIKIGVRSDMVDQAESVRQRALDGGYDLDVVVFNDSIQPNVALSEGSIDINWYQHEPYLKNYNESNGTDLVMIKPKTFYPLFGMFSEKWQKLDEIPDGATIGLCNDATNKSRALFMLQDEGLIKLDESVESPTEFDVKENPHNFKFIEAEMSVLPQSISDCDAICLAAGHMVNAGKSIENPLCESKDNDTYAVGMVVRAEDKDAQWAKDLAKLVQCDELAEYFKTDKRGTQVPTWK